MPGKDNLGHPYPVGADALNVHADFKKLAESIGIAGLYANFAEMDAALPSRPIGALAATMDPPATWMWQGQADWGAHSAPPQWVPVTGRVPVLGVHKQIAHSIAAGSWQIVNWEAWHMNRYFDSHSLPESDFVVPFPGVYSVHCRLHWGVDAGGVSRAVRLIDATSGHSLADQGSLSVQGWGLVTSISFTGHVMPQMVLRINALCSATQSLLPNDGAALGCHLSITWIGAW